MLLHSVIPETEKAINLDFPLHIDMVDVFPKKLRSEIMSRIRSKNTKCEILLRRHLRSVGVRGYRLHYHIIGKPDIAFPKQRLAVFCDSDFWHGLKNIPKSNRNYWENKLKRNKARDRKVNKELKKMGWSVLRLKESDILKRPEECAKKVMAATARDKES